MKNKKIDYKTIDELNGLSLKNYKNYSKYVGYFVLNSKNVNFLFSTFYTPTYFGIVAIQALCY